jgi:hypothetical protein
MRILVPAILLWLLAAASPLASAEPTSVDVHVLSRDAKFVGSGVGGVRVTIADAATGEMLAQGITEGGTGDTDLIMGEREHGKSLIAGDTAGFSATLDLTAPRLVRVTAHGPLGYPESANTVSATQWLLPGRSAGEQGWILELPGLIVDVHDTPALVQLEEGEARVEVQATVRMMCGCPLTPDGLWDSNEFEIHARLMLDNEEITGSRLDYAGEASEFHGELLLTRPGTYRLSVQAHQPRTGNTGAVDRPLVAH